MKMKEKNLKKASRIGHRVRASVILVRSIWFSLLKMKPPLKKVEEERERETEKKERKKKKKTRAF